MQEPSVLDYIKSVLDPRRPRLQIPWDDPHVKHADGDRSLSDLGELADEESITLPEKETVPLRVTPPPTGEEPISAGERVATPVVAPSLPETVLPVRWPLLSLWALVFALFGQRTLEPPGRDWGTGVALYLLGAVILVGAHFRKEWQLAPFPGVRTERDPLTVRQTLLMAAGLLSVAAFFTFSGNRLTRINLTLWLAALGCLIGGLWLPARSLPQTVRAWIGKVRPWLPNPQLNIHLTPWMLLVLGVFLFSAFFRYYRLDTVPPEMISDHAEKLLDVQDVLDGRHSIFFERNTGREPFQFYLTALVAIVFNTGISFMSLKLGTATAGMVTLIYMYKLGVEIGNRRVGLLAAAFTGIAYWPNVISRIALRFALYPLFAAPALYYLIRGMRRQSRNDFILAGVALGLGLHGYSSFRAIPVLVVIAAGLFALHHFSVLQKPWFWIGFSSTVIVSVVIFLPLLRYITETPEQRNAFSYRFMTRVSGIENPLPAPAGQIFLKNLGRGLAMFGWDDGETWPHSVTHRPALDVVSAVLFHLGVILVLVRYVQKRDWLDIFLLVSIPILMLPSILSLAFPGENPSLNRPAGAYVPVFLILALSLDGLMRALEKGLHGKRGTQFAWGLALLLFFWASSQNYDLVFRQYFRSYRLSSWNTTELGKVIRGYISSGIGDENGVWIVGYPHWVDTRLASMIAGYPHMDFGVIPEEMLSRSEGYPGPKMFLLHPQAFDSIQTLQTVYPGGVLTPYESIVETKDFWIYFVPGTVPANTTTP
ncbi:MAG TPA: glycosyltransferase family 39 protein [Anaerolineales bacterium]|nr:glycosyltransferase family 39 protein [Anaerolineales bacterium]